MLLKMTYQIEGDERLFYEWKKIKEVRNRVKTVIAFVRTLPKWENCVFLGFERDTPEPDSLMRVYFRQDADDIGEGKERKRMMVEFHISHQEETITRDEFCQIIDEIVKHQPKHKKFLKDFAKDPEIDDAFLNWTKNLLFEDFLKKGLNDADAPIN
jgi:hypothetical protein